MSSIWDVRPGLLERDFNERCANGSDRRTKDELIYMKRHGTSVTLTWSKAADRWRCEWHAAGTEHDGVFIGWGDIPELAVLNCRDREHEVR